MRIALLGAGSIGSIIGALMSRGGEDIVLVNTNQAHVDALNRYGARIVGFAEDSIPVTAIRPEAMTGNLPGVRCAKLTDNATFSAMSAILACNFGQILDSYEAMRCIAYLGREAARIIAALGIRTEAVFGLEPTVGNLGFASVEELHKVIFQYWPTIYTPSRPGRSSMLQDLEKGRKSEID